MSEMVRRVGDLIGRVGSGLSLIIIRGVWGVRGVPQTIEANTSAMRNEAILK